MRPEENDEVSADIVEQLGDDAVEHVTQESIGTITYTDSDGRRIKHPQMYGGPKRTKIEAERDREFIARLYLEGKTQYAIAQELATERDYTLSVVTISTEIQKILQQWRLATLKNTEVLVARELERLSKLESEYWDAWYRSMRDAEVIEVYEYTEDGQSQKEIDKEGARTKGRPRKRDLRRKMVITGQVGDPRFPQGIERCIELRMRLLGLDQGRTVNVNWRKIAEKEGFDPERLVSDLAESLFSQGVKVTPHEDPEEKGE